MPVKTVRNVTSFNIKRQRVHNGVETVTKLNLTAKENNTNIKGADLSQGNPIVYFGYDYIPLGTAQYDANPAP